MLVFFFLHGQNLVELKTKDFVSIQTKDKQNFFWYTKRQEKKNKKKENKKEKKRVRETCGIKKDRSQKKVARGRAGPTLYINNHNDKEDICILKWKAQNYCKEKRKKKNLRFTTSWKSVHVSCSEFLIFNVYAPEKKVKNKKKLQTCKKVIYIYTVTHMVKFKSPPCDQLHTYGSNKIMIIKYETLERRNKKSGKK